MTRNRYLVSAISAAMVALMLIATPLSAEAGKNRSKGKGQPAPGTTVKPVHGNGNEQELPLSKAQLYFELNHTDGDLGIHGLIDGDAWMFLEIEDPNERTILRVLASGRMRQQGMTELFFESAEPPFDELSPEDFFKRFPEGSYEIEAISLEGDEMEGEATLSHILAAPPSNITLSGVPAAEDCDAELPVVPGPVVVDWDPVTNSHPKIGREGPVEIKGYEFIVEGEDVTFQVILPPSVTQFEIPPDILATGTEFKFEIIAKSSTGNNTAVESCFLTEE